MRVLAKFDRMEGRVRRTFAAQIFHQVATLAIQLATIPLLVFAWGLETYGVWLLLTAIPTFLTLSDFGLTFVAKNAMSMQVAHGDRHGAIETFQSILALLVGIGAALLLAAAALIWLLPLDQLFDLGATPVEAARVVLSAQVSAVLLYQGFLLLCAGLRADGRPASETAFGAAARLAEAASVCVAALCGADVALAALAGLSARILALLALAIYTRRTAGWLPFGLSHARASRLRALTKPSLSYMLVPLANALLIQGPVVVLGATATPAAVALFSVTRTVARLGMAGANMLNFTFTPEYSYAFGGADRRSFRANARLHAVLLLAGTAAYLPAIAFVSGPAVERLSHGAVSAVPVLTAIMAASVALEMLWTGLFAPLAALNRHQTCALAFAALSVAAVALAAAMPGVRSLAVAVLGVQAAMLLIAAQAARRLFGASVSSRSEALAGAA